MRKSLSLFITFFCFCISFYSQNIEEIHKKIINSYDKIEINDEEIERENDVKKLYNQSKEINYPEGVLRGLLVLQRICVMQSDHIPFGKYSDEAEILANDLNDYNALSITYFLKGRTNLILGKSPEGEANLKTSLKYAEKIKNQADKHIQLCRIYATLAGMAEETGTPKTVYNFIRKSLNAIETTPNRNLTEYQKSRYYYLYIFQLMNISNYYGYSIKPPKPKLAEPYIQRVMAFEKSSPEYFKILNIEAYRSISNFYIVNGEYQNAIVYAQKVLEVEKNKNNPRHRLFAYENIKNAYQFLNKPIEENKYLRLYTALKDSINATEKKAIVHQSREEIKKSDVKNKQSKRSFLWMGVGIILIITISSWFLVQRKNKLLRKNYEQMIKKLKAEALTQPKEIDNTSNDFDLEQEIESETDDSEIAINRTTISTVTEARILKRLEAFEKSEKFLKKDFTINMLSTQLNTNNKYLSEIIKNNRSQNFSNYLNNLRISYIVHKLYNEPKYRDYKISYLAEECGYASPQVFVIAFKKINGVTPSYFIQNLQEDQNLINN